MNLFWDQISTVILLLLFVGQQTEGIDAQQDLDYRLPKTVIPSSYEILLMPELKDDFKFEGRVHINATVRESTNTIILHHEKMEILKLTVTRDKESQEIANTSYNNVTEKYEITLRNELIPGTTVSINIAYRGNLRDDMVGFYRSSYFDSKGTLRWLASTQFQTTHARHAFPCFDEPSFKAKFIVRILRPAEYTCLSNMRLKNSIKLEQNYWDEFEESIPMSTYLVAFVISEFEAVKMKRLENFNVWARPDAIDQAKYALTIGIQGLEYLSNRFQQNYQLPKMDMVAVPDFSAGAMENWGLITYRESRLLYDEPTTSDIAKQNIASVIIHELTHMWFGNMITPEWWSYLWLSEAFARYFQYFATAQVEKTWNMEEQFLVEQHHTAYASDGIETSQPMTRDVKNSSQISSIGDTITYNKGASIVRMMNLIFGSEVFDATLQNYLIDNKQAKVAKPENFWLALQREINRRQKPPYNVSVAPIMTTWTEQPGFPVVTVAINNGVVTLRQQRFLLRNLKSTPTNLTWYIPITWATQENPNFDRINVEYWLQDERDTININESSGWVIFNVQSAGFYRVNYDNESWYRIIKVLNSKNYADIHVLNRAAIVDDLLNLARTGFLPYPTAFDGLQYLKRENNYLPFKAAFSALTYLDQRFSGLDQYHKHLKEFVLFLIEDTYKRVGYVDRPVDDRLTVLLRGELNKWACNYGHKSCVQIFTKMFRNWKQDNMTIDPNQRPVAYCMGIKYGTEEDWDFLWKQYYDSNSATEQSVILEALGCTQNTALLEKYLLYALKNFTESRIRMQDNSAVFAAVYSSSAFGAEFVLNFVEKYQDEMTKFYNGTDTISSILSLASKRFSTQRSVDKFEDLIRNHETELKNNLDSLNNALQISKYELLWAKNYSIPITSWLISFNNDHHESKMEYRLPASLKPTSYEVWIQTDVNELDNFTFSGTVSINAIVEGKTQNITLHSSGLDHSDVLVHVRNETVAISRIEIIEKYDFMVIVLNEELQVGENVLVKIGFAGHLNEEMRGFYRSSYVDGNNETRWLAATHMEPVGARKMFPCFDEPALKATFKLKVNVPKNFNAASNMPIDKELNQGERREVSFEKTPKMSTYLFALVVSDFARLNDSIFGVWARRDAIEDGRYALSVMNGLVEFFERSLGIPYQLPKLDMVALPDFVSGAMENWGLLTYKERNVLYNRRLSSTASKQSIINVISHEISHQWFGDLVSPLWWKYLWLNEGFARYFQYFATKNEEPTWSLESQFIVEQLHSAFEADSSPSTHAMTHDVYSPTEIRGIFDSISYAKSASVIRMIEKVLGREEFFQALGNYLKKRQYDVATPEDLFEAFKEKVTNQTIKNLFLAIMNNWTTQPGYPVLYVTLRNDRMELRQDRFFLNPDDKSPRTTWYIPISWTNLNDPNFTDTKPKVWFNVTQDTVQLPSKHLYLLNVQQSGYYRVNYDYKTWQDITDFLKSDKYSTIHEINRAALIDDLLNLGRAGQLNYSVVLNATQYLVNETNYIPWRAFFNGLTYVQKQLEQKDNYNAFVRYVTSLLTPIYNKLGFKDKSKDDHVTLLFRSHVRKWACKFNVTDCKEQALSHFDASNNGATLEANIRSVSYCTVAEQNDRQLWNRLWELYTQSTFSAVKSVILQSLPCATEDVLLKDLLQKAITKDSGIRFEDRSSVFTSVINSSPEGVESVIDFVRENYDKIYEQISNVNGIVNAIGKKVFTNELYAKYVELVNLLEEKGSLKNARGYVDNALRELKWNQNNVPKIYQWLEENYPSGNYRLPKLFSPLRYDITLSPYFEERNFTFDGNVKIDMKPRSNYVSRIVIHSNKLDIKNVSVYETNSVTKVKNSLRVSGVIQNTDTQMLTIFLDAYVSFDIVTLQIDFVGKLNDNMEGFYRSYYTDSKGNIRWLATTHFEPIYARQAFPCFDEPAFKAKFTIRIERYKEVYNTLSNMPRLETQITDKADRVVDTFDETPLMSTYLVAFVVSDFKSVKEIGEKVNVWGRPDIVSKGELAETVATTVLESLFMETGHAYDLPKLDLIGIPDFSMGAMENWGLVTFREYGLFYDKNVTSSKYEDYIITIIAHELAHMMFGNLVTCDWWDYIWLNEGFAEFMQWRLANSFRSFYGYNDMFVVDELQVAMQNDASESTHPMINPVSKPADISKIFDSVTYGKSSSVIRMIQKSLKPGTFQRAVNLYLTERRFNTSTPNDLWSAFDKAIKETNDLGDWQIDMKTLMHGWTNERGYPVVYAILKANTITLTQKSFNTKEIIDDFYIPITMTTASQTDFETTWTNIWLNSEPRTLRHPNPSEWFVVNVQQSGYYRVNYDVDSWTKLIDALNETDHGTIDVTNRAQIIDDLLNLARAGHVDYEIALNGTTYLWNEKYYIPWKAFFNGLNFILQRYQGRKGEDLVKRYALTLANGMYEKIGFVDDETESHSDHLSRDLILTWMCRLGHKNCVNTSVELFANWMKKGNSISPNARAAVYCTAIREGNQEKWEFLWEKYRSANFASEKKIILDALGCSSDKETLNSYLRIALNQSSIRKQDINAVFASVYNSGEFGVDTIIDFLINNYEMLHDYYDNWEGVQDLISKLAPKISTQNQLAKLKELNTKENVDVSIITSSIDSTIEIAVENMKWYEKYSEQINAWCNHTIRRMQPDDGNAATSIVPNNLAITFVTVFSLFGYLLLNQ